MNKIVAALLTVLAVSGPAFGGDAELREQLVGEWSGAGANLRFDEGGKGKADTGMCQFSIGWSVSGGMLGIRYLSDPECSYKDYQVGTVAKKMPRPADETVRFTIGKSSETGVATLKLTLFNKNAPQGAAYHRADMDQIASDAPKLDRAACNKAMTDAQRECDQRGGKQHEVLACRNSAMMKYIGCL